MKKDDNDDDNVNYDDDNDNDDGNKWLITLRLPSSLSPLLLSIAVINALSRPDNELTLILFLSTDDDYPSILDDDDDDWALRCAVAQG